MEGNRNKTKKNLKKLEKLKQKKTLKNDKITKKPFLKIRFFRDKQN